jgi:hypothetical protein
MRILDGRVFAFFAFDIGFEIDLEHARRLLDGTRAAGLKQDRPAPAELRYPDLPVEVSLGEQRLDTGVTASVSARLFDFGVVSIGYAIPAPATLADLAPYGRALLEQAGLAAVADRQMRALVPRVAPAVKRLEIADFLCEDYIVFQVSTVEGRADAAGLVRDAGAELARAVTLEPMPLAPGYVEELLATAVTYAPNDVVLSDWSAAFIYDQRYDDTVAVLEYLNIQLLELRFQDRRLDAALERFATVKRGGGLGAFLNPYRQPVRELAELTMDSTLLSERAANAIKLLGDDYLARVARRAGERLHLADWAASIRRKQDAVARLYETLNDQLANTRAEALELAIVLLIIFEIALYFSE